MQDYHSKAVELILASETRTIYPALPAGPGIWRIGKEAASGIPAPTVPALPRIMTCSAAMPRPLMFASTVLNGVELVKQGEYFAIGRNIHHGMSIVHEPDLSPKVHDDLKGHAP